ncbi:MAG: molybdenum cofactor biosynthesis protein B [Gammaproteobacteria bacterium]|nr:molybdenum cofactor biosynthesis protein B [Gammaproteobacteria bacterium]
MSHQTVKAFKPLNIAVLTVSDTRDETTDTSGKFLANSLVSVGHTLSDKKIVIDDVYKIREIISQWVANDDIQVIISTGGTGFTDRDRTPEAIRVLFDREIEGFGELFRHISYTEIGTSTVQSRAFGGFANGTAIFCVPGSTGACRTAWDGILLEQLDIRHKPCNFAAHVKQVK